MADISKIILPNGSEYDIKDAAARARLDTIEGITGALLWLGMSDNAITDSTGATITVGGASVTAEVGGVTGYGNKEYVWNGTSWQEFGDLTGLGTLAWEDSASGIYTPAGTVSQPTFSGTQGNISVNGTLDGGVTIATGTGTANYTPAGTVSQPTFSGSEGNVSVTGSATGNVTIGTGVGTANYTPAGTVGAPSINVASAGATTTVNSITAVGTLPELTTSVASETLTIGFSQGTLPTKGDDVTVKTGDAAYSATAPSFTGTGVELTGTFSNGSVSASGTFTPTGTVSQPGFTGTGVELTGSLDTTAVSATGTFTPAGTVSQPTFSGTQDTITVAPSA